MKKLMLLCCCLVLLTSCYHTETDYYPNGAVKSVIRYKNKKEDGLSVYYREDGSKALEIEMKDGKKNGKLVRWFSNNVPESVAYYRNDSLEGNLTIYDRKGFPLTQIEYHDGKKEGAYFSWHARDVIREKGFFKNDLYDGEWEYYDKRGVMVGEAAFRMGEGLQTGYDAFGNLLQTTHYAHNMKNGEEIHYASNGDTLVIIQYKDDRILSIDTLKK